MFKRSRLFCFHEILLGQTHADLFETEKDGFYWNKSINLNCRHCLETAFLAHSTWWNWWRYRDQLYKDTWFRNSQPWESLWTRRWSTSSSWRFQRVCSHRVFFQKSRPCSQSHRFLKFSLWTITINKNRLKSDFVMFFY